LDRIRAKVPVQEVSTDSIADISGHYSSPGPTVVKRIGGVLSGDELYLFPDGTYIYMEWSDVSPMGIRDKGTWHYSENVVRLTSDKDIKWDPGVDRELVAFRRASVKDEVFLMGSPRDLKYFETAVDNNDTEWLLLTGSKERTGSIKPAGVAKLKANDSTR
jgi:hypothetical protein